AKPSKGRQGSPSAAWNPRPGSHRRSEPLEPLETLKHEALARTEARLMTPQGCEVGAEPAEVDRGGSAEHDVEVIDHVRRERALGSVVQLDHEVDPAPLARRFCQPNRVARRFAQRLGAGVGALA